MAAFEYHDLHDTQFESIVVSIGQKLFGMGRQGFTPGPDGGRDAKFVGTAELFPSSAKPWTGCTIIQAKHTSGINASYSDKAFVNVDKETGSFVKEEIPRIQKLVSNGEANNYMIVSNRSLTGNTQTKITNYISNKCGLNLENISV